MPQAQFVDVMTVYPQHCIITGGGNQFGQDQALDLGVDIPEYGRIYISASGMEYLATLFGYSSPFAVEEGALGEEDDVGVLGRPPRGVETSNPTPNDEKSGSLTLRHYRAVREEGS